MFLTIRRLFITILFVALFVMATREISDPDFWWHLRAGQYIVETHSVPHTDIFSYTRAGQPWVAHEWLAEVLIYAIFSLGSFPALILVFSAIITLGFWLVYLRSPGKPYVAGLALLLAAFATAPTWGVRPQMISLLLTSFYLWVLERHRRSGGWRGVWILAPLMILWVNLHSGFGLGLTLIALYLFGQAVEHAAAHGIGPTLRHPPLVQLGGVFALSLLVVPLNPNGATMYVYPFETLTSGAMQAYIQEWFSPDFHLLEFQPFAWLLLATFAAAAAARRRIAFTDLVLLFILGYAALRSARNIPIFALVAAPILAESVWALVQERGGFALFERNAQVSRAAAALNWMVLAALVAAGAGRVGLVLADQPRVERTHFPAAAVDFLQSQGVKGLLYNSYAWGGYLIWRLYPGTRVFIDGRADVYGDAFIEEEFLKAYRGGPDWRSPLDRYDVGTILVEPDAPLVHELAQDAGWRQVYADPQAVIFEKAKAD